MTAISEGTRLGPYRIVRLLGEGGMGAVYEARHEAIERKVAIKVLHAQYAADAEFTERFINEARAVNIVDHPGLVQLSDYGRLPDGTAYIVMEYLKGETLGRKRPSNRTLREGGKCGAVVVVKRVGLGRRARVPAAARAGGTGASRD
jgi:serine/threonine protein kinase